MSNRSCGFLSGELEREVCGELSSTLDAFGPPFGRHPDHHPPGQSTPLPNRPLGRDAVFARSDENVQRLYQAAAVADSGNANLGRLGTGPLYRKASDKRSAGALRRRCEPSRNCPSRPFGKHGRNPGGLEHHEASAGNRSARRDV